MKKFLYRILLLLVCYFIIITPLVLVYDYNIDHSILSLKREKFNCERTVFMGSSHGRDAFLDGVIPDSYNLSSSGFTLEESSKELKRVVQECDTIETVVISFSVFSFRRTNTEPVSTNVIFDYKEAYGDNPYLSFFRNRSRKEFLKTISSNEDARFQHTKSQLPEEAISSLALRQYNRHTEVLGDERVALDYFEEILSLAREHNIRLIFVVTPFSTSYLEALERDQRWKADLELLRQRASTGSFEFYNFQDFFEGESPESKNFSDASHLNVTGAETFTRYLESELGL
jgi:hypothetical protein